MAILWDAPLASAVAEELTERLGGARLRAVFLDQPARNLLLFFREGTLVFRLHPLRGEVTLHPPVDEPPEEARPLQAKLRRVDAPADERLLVFRLTPVRSGREPMEIVVELLPNRWNAVVLETRSRIIRHVLLPSGAARGGGKPGGRGKAGSGGKAGGGGRSGSGGKAGLRSGQRELLSGSEYEPPTPSTREGADGELSLERWLEILLPVEPEERKRALLRNVALTASLNVPALLGEGAEGNGEPDAGKPDESRSASEAESVSGKDAASEAAYVARSALTAGWQLWQALVSGNARPCLLRTPKGPHPYPIPLPHLAAEPCGCLLDAFEATVEAEGEVADAALIPSDLLGQLEEGVKHAEKRVRQLEAELERAPDAGPIRAIGDLILARFGEIPTGRTFIELTDFEGQTVKVELDPTLPPHRNAERYYDEAARAERAQETVPRLIEKAQAKADELSALLEQVRGAGSGSGAGVGSGAGAGAGMGAGTEGEAPELNVAALRKLIEEKVPQRRSQKGQKGGARQEAPLLPYQLYRSSGGLEIRVGRGAASNDDLTFHHSSPDDIWLHARQVGGAHVILRWNSDDNPPARDLYEAGVLAALNSKARTAGSAPVDWTRRKYVRKPRKSPPGAVLPTRVATIFVEPDAAVAKRMAVE